MATKKKRWYEQMSFWTGITAIATGAGGLATQTMDMATAIQTIIGGFAVIFVRRAVEEAKTKE
jgi:hypothetical protein